MSERRRTTSPSCASTGGCTVDDLERQSAALAVCCSAQRLRNHTHPKITLDERPQLLIPHNRPIARDPTAPSLESKLHQSIVLLVGGCRCLSQWKGREDRLGTGDGQCLGQLEELGVGARNRSVCSFNHRSDWTFGVRIVPEKAYTSNFCS